jgi:hypothetical protein
MMMEVSSEARTLIPFILARGRCQCRLCRPSGAARRGEGTGRALCRRVLEQARADGYRAMQFNAVVETNTPAIRLWRSFGFQILATAPEAFRHPAHGYVGLHKMYMPL